jgi:hypothetical protein
VKHLCDCTQWYDNSVNYITADLVIEPPLLEHSHPLLALYYRSLYGGMKCDMMMLQNAMYYYLGHPQAITATIMEEMDYDNIGSTVEILQEAIDFHPFPGLLTRLTRQTRLSEQDIKMAIWFVESAVNVRKPSTMKQREQYAREATWKAILPSLPLIRRIFYPT